jgi:hypothetical protein
VTAALVEAEPRVRRTKCAVARRATAPHLNVGFRETLAGRLPASFRVQRCHRRWPSSLEKNRKHALLLVAGSQCAIATR